MKKLISVCLCICIFAAQLSGCSDMSFPGSDGPSDAEKLEKIRTSGEYPEILVETAEKCPQTLDCFFIGGITAQMETADSFDCHNLAFADHPTCISDGIPSSL